MSVLAVVTKPEEIRPVVTWAAEFAVALDTMLTVLCWSYSPNILQNQPQTSKKTSTDALITDVRRFIAQAPDKIATTVQRLRSKSSMRWG